MAAASKYRYGVYQDGLRGWRRDSRYDYFTHTTPANGIVSIHATLEEAQAEADRLNPKRDPAPGARELPTYAVCDLNEESTYVTGQNVGQSGSGVVAKGKYDLVSRFGR
jgi:hypothetical protein